MCNGFNHFYKKSETPEVTILANIFNLEVNQLKSKMSVNYIMGVYPLAPNQLPILRNILFSNSQKKENRPHIQPQASKTAW